MDATTLRHRTPQRLSVSVKENESPSPLLGSPITLQYASNTPSPTKSKYIPISNFSYPSSSDHCPNISVKSHPLDGNGWKQRVSLFVSLIFLAAPWIRHSQIQWKVSTLRDELKQLQNDQLRLQSRLRTQRDALQKIKLDSDRQHRKNDELLAELRAHGDNYYDFDSEHYAAAEQLENAYFQRVEELEREIQRSADRNLASRGYGTPFRRAEAIRVEILLRDPVATYGNRLVMELGPLNFFSHTIELFLMLVEQKQFYDRLTLIHRSTGRNVISTVPMDSKTLQITSSNFQPKDDPVLVEPENSLPTETTKEEDIMYQLAMLEHSEDYPIQKYSVLFVDKGPHFYINMDNKPKNVMTETCFGLIVEGQAILDFLSKRPDKTDQRGLSMVGIDSVRVLEPVEKDAVGIDPRIALPLS